MIRIPSNKKQARLRRAKKARNDIRRGDREFKLTVIKSLKHFSAMVIRCKDGGDETVAHYSTQGKDFNGGGIEAAKKVGLEIAKLAKEKGVEKVAFDRSGYKYHGRVKACATAAREGGLDF